MKKRTFKILCVLFAVFLLSGYALATSANYDVSLFALGRNTLLANGTKSYANPQHATNTPYEVAGSNFDSWIQANYTEVTQTLTCYQGQTTILPYLTTIAVGTNLSAWGDNASLTETYVRGSINFY